MTPRPFWHARIEAAWRKAPIVWLSGVRRVGKTTLAGTLEGAEIVNCDLRPASSSSPTPKRFIAPSPPPA